MDTTQKAIILAADYHYESQLMTTIKSICLHNKNIKFYLLNKDYPTEWFDLLNLKLKFLNSQIINVKINGDKMLQYKTYNHINSDSTYFRYFIPALPEDKVLYLDSDLVVNGSLSELFNFDLGNNFVAASHDLIANTMNENNRNSEQFNAGVLIINNQLWKEENILQKALEYTELHNDTLVDGDQEVLNYLFKDRWLKLDKYINYLAGFEYINEIYKLNIELENLEDKVPLIVHYNTAAKPWNNQYKTRFRELYWKYYDLEWSRIIEYHNA